MNFFTCCIEGPWVPHPLLEINQTSSGVLSYDECGSSSTTAVVNAQSGKDSTKVTAAAFLPGEDTTSFEQTNTELTADTTTTWSKEAAEGTQQTDDAALKDEALIQEGEIQNCDGETRKDTANGHGIFHHPSGDIYEGQWRENKAHGKGRFTHADGSSYDGQWVMDMQEGYGVERWVDGSSYEGFYASGMKTGEGYFRWPDNSSYRGQFKENNLHGHGTYEWNDGRKYIGDWVQNHMEGYGRMILPDGRVHEGMYRRNRKNGTGRLVWPDGHYFEGEWDDGKHISGVGRYFDASGREIKRAQQQKLQQHELIATNGCSTTVETSAKEATNQDERHMRVFGGERHDVTRQREQHAGKADSSSKNHQEGGQQQLHSERDCSRNAARQAGDKKKKVSKQGGAPSRSQEQQQYQTAAIAARTLAVHEISGVATAEERRDTEQRETGTTAGRYREDEATDVSHGKNTAVTGVGNTHAMQNEIKEKGHRRRGLGSLFNRRR